MAHTVNVCTPLPFIQSCYKDMNNGYMTYHLGTPLLSGTYTPSDNTYTVSACTPTPVAQACYNTDSNGDKYMSYHLGIPLVSYTYIPSANADTCTTTVIKDKIVTKCRDTITTVHLSQPSSQNLSTFDMQQQLNTIDHLLQNTRANLDQMIQKMDALNSAKKKQNHPEQTLQKLKSNQLHNTTSLNRSHRRSLNRSPQSQTFIWLQHTYRQL